MSAKYTHDLVVSTGEYTTSEGQTKKRWMNIGKVFRYEDGSGISIKLDALPIISDWDGWVSVFQRKERGQRNGEGSRQQAPQEQRQARQDSAPPRDFDDELPF